jgi:predicted NAD-dependent protein-ADP-ribosyltransferase YbiA (DUF1768 family)
MDKESSINTIEELKQSLSLDMESLIDKLMVPYSDPVTILGHIDINDVEKNMIKSSILRLKTLKLYGMILGIYPGNQEIEETDTFFFFSKSASKPPGKGVNEIVSGINVYRELSSIPDWRKKLSNFAIGEFHYEERWYRSVKGAFQSHKIRTVSPEKAEEFVLTRQDDGVYTGSELAMGSGEDARAQRKMIMLNNEQLAHWDRIKNKVMEGILYAKFSQIPEMKILLLATGNAILMHGTRGTPKMRQYALENVRSRLRKE